MSKEELQKLADSYFNDTLSKGVDAVLMTSDGQVFRAGKRNAADLHAKQKGGLKIYTFERPAVKVVVQGKTADSAGQEGDESPLITMTVKQVQEWVKTIDEKDQLTAALDIITTKGGRAAVEDRITELASSAAPEQTTPQGDTNKETE